MKQKLLLIDDSVHVHELLRVRLGGEGIDLLCASDGLSGIQLAKTEMPDLILLDVAMPGTDGFEVCRQLKSDPLLMNIPVIFLSGSSSTEQKIHGLDLGAVDYITKPFEPAELRARVRSSLRTKYLLDLLAQKAQIDALTGLWNRRYFDDRLHALFKHSQRHQVPLALLLADIDGFKSINDRFGHPAGDRVLRDVGRCLGEKCRVEDIICRYGGEEFAVLAPATNAAAGLVLAERLRGSIHELAYNFQNQELHVTISIGLAECAVSQADSLVRADQALYQAKETGRDRVVTA